MQKIKTRLCDILKLKTPIFQGPMAGATTLELASAVANHGGSEAILEKRVMF